jgi:hypothetical protein
MGILTASAHWRIRASAGFISEEVGEGAYGHPIAGAARSADDVTVVGCEFAGLEQAVSRVF